MKNIVIIILLLTTIVVGYYAATTFRVPLEGLEGRTATITRGDLTVPINANGVIEPARRTEIKSEASGEVIEIAKDTGDAVAMDDLIIRLLKDDELRNVARATQDLQSAEANLETARLELQRAETADLENAEARVDELEAALEYAKFRKIKLDNLPEHQRSSEEMVERETTLRRQESQLRQAQAALERAKLAVPLARQIVKQAEARNETAKNNLGDAQKRLADTDIRSPIDGIVADVKTQIGEVIQGGKTTFTGGTVLAVVLDMDKILVRAEVDEADIGRVLDIAPAWATPGHDDAAVMPADLEAVAEATEHLPKITVESFRNEEFVGIIERIHPEPISRSGVVTYLVDVVVISENKRKLLSGMRADVSFTSEHASNVLLCPNEAIREGADGSFGVYIPKPGVPSQEREVEFVSCKFGLDNGNYSEVREGLEEGAVVYIKLPHKQDKG